MRTLVALALIAALGLAAPTSKTTTLKSVYRPYFRIGVAINERQFEGLDPVSGPIIVSQFNQISPENALKWSSIHPRADEYNFTPADHYVAFGERNKMFIVGHCLVWHSQVPKAVFVDAEGKPLTRDALLESMHEHIRTVVGRYKGRIGGWDVVNEALNDDGTMRQSQWYRIIGEDFIEKAFEFAHEADPKAQLYYNDYSLENDAKRRGAVELLRRLQSHGVPITGVGLQGHMHMDTPTAEKEAQTIEDFAALGLRVNISELDVDVLPRTRRSDSADITSTAEGSAQADPYVAGLPNDVQRTLANRYATLFQVFLEHHRSIDRVTLWGTTDAGTWLNNFPTRGRTNHPLLFDRAGEPKPAFAAVAGQAVAYGKRSGGRALPKK